MVGAMVSASTGAMNSLLGKLATLMGEEYGKLKGVRKEVASLENEFSSMKALLENLADMEELDALAKEWRNQVKDMSYDIEDCIDDFMHHIGENDATTGFVNKTARLLKKLRVRHQIASKIQEIKICVKDASERRTRYKLDEYTSKPSYVPVDPRVVAIHTEAANLVGIDVPREELVELVTGQEQELKVVSIVGFGGLGKTTLANQVYHKLKGQFECKAFVSVSQKPDLPMILNKILQKIGGRVSHTGELDDDLENIKNHLLDKRYFIVIDDLWGSSAWEIIKCAFPENNVGSRVMTTTRIYDVALSCCSWNKQYVYNMRPLNEENARRLFFSRTFGASQVCPTALEELSTDILKKCGGLPLAIVSIASLLAGQSNSKWEYVRNSLGSMFEGNPNLGDMKRILDLSYKNLPLHLKTCLLYIGMYPEDHIIRKDDLLRQWIAEGFVSKVRGLDAEDVARSYFNELINMSMLQPMDTDYDDEVLSCRVHDIMLDLIRVKSAEENFVYVIDDTEATKHNKARRVSLHHAVAIGQIPKAGNGSLSQVRSFVDFTGVSIASLEGFKYVRVLHLKFSGYKGQEKLDLTVISGLFLLRYLKIESLRYHLELPNQLFGLRHLETMYTYDGMCETRTIPLDIVRLHRLSHLILPDGAEFRCGIGTLKSLCTLRGFDISKSSLDSVKSLGELTNLRDLQMCCHGDHVDDMALNALQTSLERLAHSSNSLKNLSLWIPFRDSSIVRPDWLSTLSLFPRKLQWLSLGVRLSRIPKWIAQLHDLCSLTLAVDKVVAKDDDIGILAGLPSLVYLSLNISRNQEEMIVMANNTGVAFPALKHLKWWCPAEPLLAFGAGALPRLQTIVLVVTVAGWEHVGKWLGPVGIEHLPAGLKKIDMYNFTKGRPDEATESALRSVFNMHHPGVDVSFYWILADHSLCPWSW